MRRKLRDVRNNYDHAELNIYVLEEGRKEGRKEGRQAGRQAGRQEEKERTIWRKRDIEKEKYESEREI